MSVPDYQSLMLPVLKVAAEGEINTKACIERLADNLGLSEDECSEMLPSGRQTLFSNRVHWAKTYLAKAGLLKITRRAHFTITERGRKVLSQRPDRIDNSALAQFPEFQEFRQRSQPATPKKAIREQDEVTTPTERIEAAHEEILKELRSEVLERVLEASAPFFERLIVDLLVQMGYGGSRADAGRAIGRSGDGGIDGIIKEDPLGLEIVYIQGKRYQPSNGIGRPEVQAFAGSLVGVGANKGVFVTTSSFSRQAREYADRIPQRLILIDGEELARLLIEHNVRIRTSHTVEIKRVDEDRFAED